VTSLYLVSLKKSRRKLTLYQLYMQVQWFAETLHDEGVLPHFESCSLDTIKNALTKFSKVGILKFKGRGRTCQVSILYPMEKLVELRENLNRFLKMPVTKGMV
jgi:hypothetical protein